ncbi:MAG: AAA family ATPase [Desulfobacterales bacterium]|nr:AAA family ATPase [Desulfobacterales bacterium]
MKRTAEKRLGQWLKNIRRKPLVIRGARQVGKSTLVRQFAEKNNLTLHEINLERYPKLTNVFASHDTDRILKELEYICQKGPVKKQGCLLFLDEIQAVPIAIQTLRYFYEDCPELPVIAAGSLLEFSLSKHSYSMPVGRVEYLFLGSVTFKETLSGLNEKDLLNLLTGYLLPDTFPMAAHERLLEILRIYFLTGGMPEAVQIYIDTNDLDKVFDVHASIIETYRDDFAKYATHADLLRLHRVFDYIPVSAGNRIKYARIDQREQARDLRRALDLLEKAQVVMKAYHTDASGIPVLASADQRKFKTFFMDCGLMNSMCGIQWISPDDLKTKDFVNKGRVAEQFVAQHIAFSGKNNKRPSLAYWLREGRSSNAEVDFVLQMGQSVIPVEVKAGKSGSLKSLLQFVCQKQTQVAIRFDMNAPGCQNVRHFIKQATDTVEVSFDLLSLPLHMVEDAERIFNAYFEGVPK